jgi:hypothetical protein
MEKFVNKNKLPAVFISALILFFAVSFAVPSKASAAFRFVGWGDSRDNPAVLSAQSNQVKAMTPAVAFTVFSGDLCGSWSTSCAQAWQGHINGGSNNGIGNITFPVRGNHDSGASSSSWSSFYNIAQRASGIGATNYSELTKDMTYSFDYQNAHFVGLDMPGGDVSSMSQAIITWLDNDLTAAEARGKKLSFLFWHGPIYYVDGHSSTAPANLVAVLNKHQSVAAIYQGHEHVLAHVTLNNSRLPGLTGNTIQEIVDGTSGAPHYSCKSGRSDFCQAVDGFAVTDVQSDTQFTISFYKNGSNTPIFQKTFTKGGGQTPVPTATPVVTATPAGRTPTPVPTGILQAADVNGDRVVNIIDIGIVVDNYNKNPIPNKKADINKDNAVNIVDIGLIIDRYGQTY